MTACRIPVDANVIRSCPVGSVLALNGGVVWRKGGGVSHGWRAEHGMPDDINDDAMIALVCNAGQFADAWLLRWGWDA